MRVGLLSLVPALNDRNATFSLKGQFEDHRQFIFPKLFLLADQTEKKQN